VETSCRVHWSLQIAECGWNTDLAVGQAKDSKPNMKVGDAMYNIPFEDRH